MLSHGFLGKKKIPISDQKAMSHTDTFDIKMARLSVAYTFNLHREVPTLPTPPPRHPPQAYFRGE